MKMKHSLGGLAAVAVGAGLAFSMGVMPAVGQISPPSVFTLRIGNDATLVARGASIIVPVSVRCPADSPFQSVSVQVTQRAGSKIASGYGGTSDFACNGATQTVNVQVNAQGMAFKRGTASAQASMYACSPTFGCTPVQDSATINIAK